MLLIALVTTAVLLGGWLLRPHGLSTGLEGLLFRFLLGLLVTVTILLPVAVPSLGTAGGILITAAVLGMTREVFRRRESPARRLRPEGPPWDGVEWACLVALVLMAFAVTLRALAPPLDPEALIVHLALAKEAVLEGRLTAIDRHPLSGGHDLGRTVRALLYLWNSTLTVAAWQALTAALAVAALFALVRRLATRRAALLAAAGFAAMPAMISSTLTMANDMLAAAFVFTALLAAVRWKQEGQSACGVLGGVLMGGACATSPMGWLALPGWFLLTATMRPRGLLRSVVITGLPALAVGGAWWLADAPMPAPTGSDTLTALRAWLTRSALPTMNLMETTAIPVWPMPEGRWPFFAWDAIMRPAWFEGPWFSPGPLAIAVGVPALLWCGRDGRRIAVFAMAFGLAVMLLHPSARLLVPACAVMIGIASVAVERSPRIQRVGRAAFAVAIAYGMALHGITAAESARVVTGLESRDAWRARHLPMAPAMAWCNQHCGEGVVLSLDPHGFLLDSPVFADYAELVSITPWTVPRQARWLSERGIRFVVYSESAVYANRSMRVAGIPSMVTRWRRSPNYFIQRAVFEDAHGMVYIYEVRSATATL